MYTCIEIHAYMIHIYITTHMLPFVLADGSGDPPPFLRKDSKIRQVNTCL